jgi:uncharacterized protein DUF6483
MIRRDYILRMIAEFIEVLNRLEGLKKGQLWQQASGLLDEQFQRLIGAGPAAIIELSETELLARVIKGEPTQVVRDKTLIVTALLKEAGDIAGGQSDDRQSRRFYLKGLHLLMDVIAEGDISDCPDFVPKVDMFTAALGAAPLPVPTLVRLMQHYERSGQFGKAEDCLFALLEAEPEPLGLVDFGIAFYERIRAQSDASLAFGNLPRAELEAGLKELCERTPATMVANP